MPLPSGLAAKQLVQMLGTHLGNEECHWQPIVSVPTSEITGAVRDEVAAWLVGLNRHYQFQHETAHLAVALLDKVLALAKVRSKYLYIVAITCFYIAAKTLEEDEVIPTTLDLVRQGACGCTVSEVVRMELVILSKLGWNTKFSTAVDFLYIIHAVLAWQCPQVLALASGDNTEQHLSWLLEQLMSCLTCHSLQRFRPATLAVALLALSLQQTTPNWLEVVHYLQSLVKVDNDQLIPCWEMMARILDERPATSTSAPPQPTASPLVAEPQPQPVLQPVVEPCPKKRKGSPDEADNIYEGIKRLYNEEGCSDGKPAGLHPSCSMEFHPETEETHPSAATICAK